MNRDNIRYLLFDLGGVIMDLRRDRAVAALIRLGMTDADDFLGLYGQKGPFLALEKGLISPEEFRDIISRSTGNPSLTNASIDEAFNCFLEGIPVARLRALEELRRRYKIYLLSNTNALMWHSRIAEEFRKDGHDIDYYFDGLLTSFEEHLYKPDPAIFLRALEKFNIPAEATLFFDDSEANTEAAAQIGMQTVYVRPNTEFIDLIR